MNDLTLRHALLTDVSALNALIDVSVRALSAGYYSEAQIDASMREVFGVDTQLIEDGTYYIIGDRSAPAAAGGWSRRRTLFGGDQMKDGVDELLDPASEAARIRAFFVHPDWRRRGLATRLYEQCANDARADGFHQVELMATLPGEPLYLALGFAATERIVLTLGGGVTLPLVRMRREISADTR